jgi:hypothetical protein
VIGESRAGAIFALGLAQTIGKELWMLLVPSDEQAPHVEAMYVEQVGRSNYLNQMELEVATYTRHSSEDLAAFMFRTKLDRSKNAYSPNTIFVFYVQRAIQPEALRETHEALVGRDLPGLSYLIGQLNDDEFQVVQVHPRFAGPVTVSLSASLELPQDPVADVQRGMSSVQTRSERPIPTANPFLA